MARTTLSALYLACSWLWCIGMYLPVLLVADFGWPAFVVFAIPNCIGAMSVGLLLSPERARRALGSHGTAIGAFSAITLLFHAVFLVGICWMLRGAAGGVFNALAAWLMPGVVLVGALLLARMGDAGWRRAGLVFFGLSVVCAVLAWLTTDGGRGYAPPPLRGEHSPAALAMAAFPITFGFLLCPFLDVSFLTLRARESERTGRAAFVLCFALFFPALILFTLAYSGAFLDRAWLSYYFPAHMLLQSMFTMGVHLRAVARRGRFPLPDRAGIARAAGCGLALAVCVLAVGPLLIPRHFELSYQLVLSMYALPLPAYVWIVLRPALRRGGAPARRLLALWAIATIAGAPALALGFLAERWAWLPLAAIVPLIAGIASRRKRPADAVGA